MSKDNPKVPASAGGQESSADPESEDALAMSDDRLRHHAAARLAEHLYITTDLVERCDHLAGMREGDRVAPLYAAARLLHGSAHVAEALSRAAQAETRHRTIVEHIQPPTAKTAHSNCSLEDRLEDALRFKRLRYLNLVADETLDPALSETQDDTIGTHEEEKTPPPALDADSA